MEIYNIKNISNKKEREVDIMNKRNYG